MNHVVTHGALVLGTAARWVAASGRAFSSSPASCTPGPDAAYFFRVDPEEIFALHTYVASACGSGVLDSTLSLVRSDGGAPSCVSTETCGTHDTLRFTLSPGTDREGLYVLFVDGATDADAGDYTLALALET